VRRSSVRLAAALGLGAAIMLAAGCGGEIGGNKGPADKVWFDGDYAEALKVASKRNSLIFVEFHADW